MNFKIKNLDHFLPSFLSKNGNFKTRDFSPLIKRVLAGLDNVGTLFLTCFKLVDNNIQIKKKKSPGRILN